METLHDYVDWVAKSMQIYLNKTQVERVSNQLIQDRKYGRMLKQLEAIIQEEMENKS